MSENNNDFINAFDLWYDFKSKLLYENRYIIKHKVLDYIQEIASQFSKIIVEDTILYRARKYDENNVDKRHKEFTKAIKHSKETGEMDKNFEWFYGYDEKGSFVPQDINLINDGRANPCFIKYLYTAEDAYTAMVEVRPYLKSKVSVANIRVKDQLTVADFSYESFRKLDGIEGYLSFLIMRDFSEPSNNNKKSYIPTQYISEFIKSLGYDGIRFSSSLHEGGKNITVFNYNKCEAKSSKIYEIEDICYEAKCTDPEGELPLNHPRLNK